MRYFKHRNALPFNKAHTVISMKSFLVELSFCVDMISTKCMSLPWLSSAWVKVFVGTVVPNPDRQI